MSSTRPAPPDAPARPGPTSNGCWVPIAIVVAAFAVAGFIGWRIVGAGLRSAAVRDVDHASWPKPTPPGALATRSPDGRFVTSSRKHGGDGASSHDDTHDCVFVALASCPASEREFTAQDRALCASSALACRATDGVLRYEHFGSELRWLDAMHVEATWIELIGTSPRGERVWGLAKQRWVVRGAKGDATACGGEALAIERDAAP